MFYAVSGVAALLRFLAGLAGIQLLSGPPSEASLGLIFLFREVEWWTSFGVRFGALVGLIVWSFGL